MAMKHVKPFEHIQHKYGRMQLLYSLREIVGGGGIAGMESEEVCAAYLAASVISPGGNRFQIQKWHQQ